MSEISSEVLFKFTLYSRTYCHLCDDMLEHLKASLSDTHSHIELVDVDADEELVAKFDELVPVLYGQKEGAEAVQICHYFLDVEKLKAFLHD
nr:glutaredoxin family protein [uncultured Undibacterium sp.]